ncbi:MAG: Clp protease N-terminal domain-containing protein [Candidatus Obscuribacterales bacterium]
MIDPFTGNSQFIFWLARKEAERQSLEDWGAEQLLAALAKPYCEEEDRAYLEDIVAFLDKDDEGPLREDERIEFYEEAKHRPSISSIVLTKCGITLEQIREVIDQPTSKRSKRATANPNADYKRITERAIAIGKSHKMRADSSHLLLSILEEDKGGAHQVLEALNADRDLIRRETLKMRKKYKKTGA